jgi:hypothetical protein
MIRPVLASLDAQLMHAAASDGDWAALQPAEAVVE